MMKKIVYTFIFFNVILFSSAFTQTKEELLKDGINYVYNLKFDSAEINFNKVILSEPKSPEGYFFYSLVQWWKIYLNKNDESKDEFFFQRIEKTLEVTDNLLEKNKQDMNALFYKGGSLGYRGLLWSMREKWLKAANDGRDAINYFNKIYEKNPENKDALFGLGIYNYFAEYVPDSYPYLKPLMLIFPKGDKIKGLEQIKESSQYGKYSKTEAKFILAYIYLFYEKNYAQAEFYSKQLNSEFPQNPVFEKYLYSSYVGLGKINEAYQGWKRVAEKCKNYEFGYENWYLHREANYYTAMCMMYMKRLGEAAEYLNKAEELTYYLDKDETNIGSNIFLLLGKYYDIINNREKAIFYYNKVLDMKNFGETHSEAEKYKNNPYK